MICDVDDDEDDSIPKNLLHTQLLLEEDSHNNKVQLTESLRQSLVYGTSLEVYKDVIKRMSYHQLIFHGILMENNGYGPGSDFDEDTRDQLCYQQAVIILRENELAPVGR